MFQYSPPFNETATSDDNNNIKTIILTIFGAIVVVFFISLFLLLLYCKYKKGRVHSENFRPPSEDQDLNPFLPGAPVSRDEHDQYREAFLQLGGNIPEDAADFENFRRQQGRRPIGRPFENIPLRDLNANRNASLQDRSNLENPLQESSLSSSLLHPPNRSSQAQSESIQSNDEILNDSSDVLPPTASFDRAASVSATTAATAAATATTVASANDDNADKLKSVTSKSKILLKRDSSSSKIIPKLPHELRLRSTN